MDVTGTAVRTDNTPGSPPELETGAPTQDLEETLQSLESLAGAEPYEYGLPPAVERQTNYISDDNLLAWLASRQDAMYGELREQMDMSRERSKVIEDLSHVQRMIDDDEDSAMIRAEMDRMLEAYAGTDYEERLARVFGDSDASPNHGRIVDGAIREAGGAGLREGLSKEIEGLCDALGRDDQLALIEIQSLTSDIRETSQLVSNLMASSSQAANTIVGNLRG